MKIFDLDFPNIGMKFCEKREYAEDIAKGIIYMKESGYFRKLEDTYRGDSFDGISPVDLDGETAALETNDGERIEFIISGVMKIGFERDDKLPIFCATLLSEDILELNEKLSDTEYRAKFKDEFVTEISKFGKYVVIFNIDDFISKMETFLKSKKVVGMSGPIKYVEITKEYNESIISNHEHNQYECFFKKDKSYKLQNEWRTILIDENHTLIDSNSDFYVMRLEQLHQAQIVDIKFLKQEDFIISIVENAE